MTGAFDERMAMLEAAADRVHQLEDLTGRGRAETGQVLQTAFDRLEVLAGRLGRMEQHVLGPPGSQASVPPPGLTPGLEGRVRNLEGVEKKVRDLEVRVVEQSLEALTESRLLREEFERMSGHLAMMTENLNQHFAMIWERIGDAGAAS